VHREVVRRITAHAEKGEVDRYIHQDIDISAIKAATALIPRIPKA
jgi:hypothetical protein